MRIAAIDIGTNSVKLLVADVTRGRVDVDHEELILSRLGEGMGRRARLLRGPLERTLEAVGSLLTRARDRGALHAVAAATQAVRAARNGGDFLKACRRRWNLDVRVLTSTEEASMAFEAATSDVRRPRPAAVDIGGGSTEIMSGNGGALEWCISMPLGCLGLLERHLKHDPPRKAEIEAAAAEVRRALPRERPWHGILVGIGGTVASLAAVIKRHREGAPWGALDRLRVPLKSVERQLDRLAQLPMEFRSLVRGMDHQRADIIVPGLIILREVMRAFGDREVLARTRGLRHALARRAWREGTHA